MLDFDMEKQCSVSLSTHNVYCCLVCGKYFKGKGEQTLAYLHSLMPEHSAASDRVTTSHSDSQHNVFIGLTGDTKGRVFCLPDNYEVIDASLNDIKYNLQPLFTKELIAKLDA